MLILERPSRMDADALANSPFKLDTPAMLTLLRILLFLLAAGPLSAASVPYGGKAQSIPGKIEAEHYDQGAPGEAYHDVDEKNHGADYRGPTQVDIEARPDASNGHGIGWTRTGEWLLYTVHIKEAGLYAIEIPVASNKDGGVFHLDIDGKDVTGPIKIPDTGGWQILKSLKVKSVKLREGKHLMKSFMDHQGESGSIGDIDFFHFVRESSAR